MVIPRTQCSFTYTTALEFRSSLRRRGDLWCFWQVAMTMPSVFLSGCKHTSLLLHQFDTLLRVFCNVSSISFTVFPLVWRDELSVNREFLTFLSCICSGRSFINVQKSKGPRILPCGTPGCMVPTADSLPFAQTSCALSVGYDWKKGRRECLFKYTLNFWLQDCVVY